MPMTRSIDMFLTLPVNRSTKSRDKSEPMKADHTVTGRGIEVKYRLMPIVTIARNILAPDETPSTKGPAIGLRKKVWSRKPDSDNAPPNTAASSIRGRRILIMMPYAVESLRSPPNIMRSICAGGTSTLPAKALSAAARHSIAASAAKWRIESI